MYLFNIKKTIVGYVKNNINIDQYYENYAKDKVRDM